MARKPTMNSTGILILKRKSYFWLLGSLVVAFALRVYLLSAQSLWIDEGTSISLSSLSLAAIADGAAKDIHPPLYYFLLHYWMPLAGQTEFAVRFLSVVAGVLVVAVTYRIARLFFDEPVALLAAGLSVLSPFQVYYSQEARMYIWVTLWSTASILALGAKLKVKASPSETSKKLKVAAPNAEQPSATEYALRNTQYASRITHHALIPWLLYIGTTIAALYTQYFAATLVIVENLAFAIWWFLSVDGRALVGGRQSLSYKVRAAIRSLAPWTLGQLVIGLAFLPWFLFVGNQLTSWPAISEPLDLVTLAGRVLNVFSVGLSLEPSAALPVVLACGVLFLLGLRWTRSAQENWGVALLVLWALVPVAFMYVVSLSRPAYNPKFLLLATPPFFILAARGLAWTLTGGPRLLRRPSRPSIKLGWSWFALLALAALAAAGFVPSLRNYYFDPLYARDDYRSILSYVDTNARTGDGILVDDKGQIGVVRYYHRGDQPLFFLPRMRPPLVAETRADVDDMLAKVTRLFAIYYATEQSDPQRIVDSRLAEKAFKARDEWHGNVRLAIYGIAPVERSAPTRLDVQVGDSLQLASYLQDTHTLRGGDILTLTLNWRAEQTPTVRYKVFVHLLDANNQVIAQRDGEPVGDMRLTTTWRPGEEIADNYGILIDPDIPPGAYRLEVGLYRADNGERLTLTARDGQALGDHLILDAVQVE